MREALILMCKDALPPLGSIDTEVSDVATQGMTLRHDTSRATPPDRAELLEGGATPQKTVGDGT